MDFLLLDTEAVFTDILINPLEVANSFERTKERRFFNGVAAVAIQRRCIHKSGLNIRNLFFQISENFVAFFI